MCYFLYVIIRLIDIIKNTIGLKNKLVKDFKTTQIEIEDFLIENVSDIIAEFVDKKGQEHYNLIKELCDNLKQTMVKMITFESFNINMG